MIEAGFVDIPYAAEFCDDGILHPLLRLKARGQATQQDFESLAVKVHCPLQSPRICWLLVLQMALHALHT